MATQDRALAVGVYEDVSQAQKTIADLRRAGFHPTEIGIIRYAGNEQQGLLTPPQVKPSGENAKRGAIGGGILGALIGTLVIAVVPGLGWFSEMGRLFEVVGGAALGAASGGAFLVIAGLYFSRAKGRLFEKELERGRIIITVNNSNRQDEAISLLSRHSCAENFRGKRGFPGRDDSCNGDPADPIRGIESCDSHNPCGGERQPLARDAVLWVRRLRGQLGNGD